MQEFMLTATGQAYFEGEYTLTDTGLSAFRPYDLPYDLPEEPANTMVSKQDSKQFVQNFLPYRVNNGPYRYRGDLLISTNPNVYNQFSPAGWARVLTLTNDFVNSSTASFLETTGAPEADVTEGSYKPIVTATALADSIILFPRGKQRDQRKNATLYCLLPQFVKDARRIAIKQKIATIIKNQVAHRKLDARITQHFIRGAYADDGTNFWQVCFIMLGLAQDYDRIDSKVNEDDFFPFTEAERTNINSYFVAWNDMLTSLFSKAIKVAYPGYYNDTYTTINRQDLQPNQYIYHERMPDGTIFSQKSYGYGKFLNNRRGFYACYDLFCAAKFGVAAGRKNAWRWIYHNLRFATYANGDHMEGHRHSVNEPAEGLQYTGANVDQMCWMVDFAMKQGWSEFFEDFWVKGVKEGLNGTASPGTGKTLKTLLMALGSYSKAVLPHNRYASAAGAEAQNSAQRIRTYNIKNVATSNAVVEAGAAVISALAKDQDIEDLHLRRPSAGYVGFFDKQVTPGQTDVNGAFRGWHASLYLEHAARGGAWNPETNPNDYKALQ